MSELVIEELKLPASLTAASAEAFIAMTELSSRVIAHEIGSTGFSFTPAEMLPLWVRPGKVDVPLVAMVGGELVGRGAYSALDGAPEALLEVEIEPDHRRRGYGSELLARLTALAQDDGRTVVQARTGGRMRVADRMLTSPTGFGSVPADDAGTAFAAAHGFSLEQVGRLSQLALPLAPDALAEREAFARERYTPDYELLTWEGPAAPEHRADIGILLTRMSTDAPAAGLEHSEDVWDADRVREMDERFADSPRARLTAVAREVATGRLVAMTNMDVPAEAARAANQWATLVLAEHRGHRLGLAVKLANAALLMRDFPGHPAITTANAAENEHMLAVNESMGFVAIAYEATFQKNL